MSRTFAVTAVLVVTLAAACTPDGSAPAPTTATTSAEWVVIDGPIYSGPRGENGPGGTGEHYVLCAHPGDELGQGDVQERLIGAEEAYTEETRFEHGQPCPDGPLRS
jgi:hypothetical protein